MQEFWNSIKGRKVIILTSGGIDSSYVILKFYEKGIPATLLHCNTHLQLQTAKEVIKKLVEKTGYSLITLEPTCSVKETLNRSFAAMDKVNDAKNAGQYQREVFECCFTLKKNPAKLFYKTLDKETVIISSIAPDEANRRRMFLGRIRNEGKWLNNHSRYNLDFGYPLRDSWGEKEKRQKYAESILDMKVESSGCRLCPIVLLFKMYDKDPQAYLRSKKYFLQNFKHLKFCGELPKDLEQFLT